jgi:hypothetical protein
MHTRLRRGAPREGYHRNVNGDAAIKVSRSRLRSASFALRFSGSSGSSGSSGLSAASSSRRRLSIAPGGPNESNESDESDGPSGGFNCLSPGTYGAVHMDAASRSSWLVGATHGCFAFSRTASKRRGGTSGGESFDVPPPIARFARWLCASIIAGNSTLPYCEARVYNRRVGLRKNARLADVWFRAMGY